MLLEKNGKFAMWKSKSRYILATSLSLKRIVLYHQEGLLHLSLSIAFDQANQSYFGIKRAE